MVLIITGGTLKGRRITPPKQPKQGPCATRPTTSRVRESMMAVLAPWLPNSRFMDGFAGSGVMGFEALSRGASHVLAVEANAKQHQLIQSNAMALGLHFPQYESRCQKLEVLLAKPNTHAPYDLAYWDPPYEAYASLPLEKMLADAVANAWFNATTQLLLEHPPSWSPHNVLGWEITDERRYGDTVVSVLTKEPVSA
ncbi:MAG: 16S rRNA (guanine(966)-N(2))-methyltransferase RsmD [Vampirovibrionales bacterium]|nr:16S rRNA (guanine(966)-N(2))-methyltransferase RsmD [Vampirovibrionales bacterium]